MASSTVEDYLKTLYSEQQKTPALLVPMGSLSSAMNVAPGTATAMVKSLAESDLVEYEPRTGVRLTANGRASALHVLRRHRLVELFLVETLKLDWSEVHEEAERLEHAVSDKVLERIDVLLGRPAVDPHGDPIPTAMGEVAKKTLTSLAECETGHSLRIARILDQDPAFLQFAERSGLTPGAAVRVLQQDPVADAVSIQCESKPPMTLGHLAAGKILVEPG
jgi:DtxR family Mn-dependent transcriptional regulator